MIDRRAKFGYRGVEFAFLLQSQAEIGARFGEFGPQPGRLAERIDSGV